MKKFHAFFIFQFDYSMFWEKMQFFWGCFGRKRCSFFEKTKNEPYGFRRTAQIKSF